MTASLLHRLLSDAGTAWALGSFGALGEFLRDPEEPHKIWSDADGDAVRTARGALRLLATIDPLDQSSNAPTLRQSAQPGHPQVRPA
ncbi:hypothetical protein [Oceanicella sp. SM1341]|uniref:DUF6925 family protein n=1 Tax=Oceanicella sp. SM1341 TaxID=1548889 RepID=UPI00130046D9|nr:hypothetical protein [Oceanicella sp. SM1341]